jgi:outer membrane lipoprotein SlyB
MKMKSILAVLAAAVFLLSFSVLSFAAGAEKSDKMGVKGTVTKIEGNEVTVKDDMGKETAVDGKDLTDIKVGEKVIIQEGIIKKLTEKPEKSEKSGQPEKPRY